MPANRRQTPGSNSTQHSPPADATSQPEDMVGTPEGFGAAETAQRSRLATGRLVKLDQRDKIELPDISDLAERLRFALRDGRIWLDTQRVALIHLSTLGSLRRELIDSLGIQDARGFLTRMGYSSGTRDAALARKLRPHASIREAFMVGPQLRILQGVSAMEPVRLEIDLAKGHFYGEFLWSESFEVDAHMSDYGLANTPVCWMQVGYASGYASTFMGRTVLYRETECRGNGAARCRIVGKPIEEWDDIEDDLNVLRPETLSDRLGGKRKSLHPLPPPREDEDANTSSENMVGVSAGFIAARNMLRKVSDTHATVLLLGETGVGKEMFARTLHRDGPRAKKPFIAVNCAAMPENLIEAELFGVEKGAFTGATQSRPGRFERAEGGTLFLDEIGSLTEAAQIKLLRAIQEREIERVGDTTIRSVDVRIVAATNEDLREAIKQGRFRDDLWYRLNVFPVRIPSLRERRDDIPLLLEHFLRRFTANHNRNVSGFTQRSVDALYQYDYPGNIRELENLIERAVIMADDANPIDLAHLFAADEMLPGVLTRLGQSGGLETRSGTTHPSTENSNQGPTLNSPQLGGAQSFADMENYILSEAVNRAGGNISKAARALGMTRPQLAYRLKKHVANANND